LKSTSTSERQARDRQTNSRTVHKSNAPTWTTCSNQQPAVTFARHPELKDESKTLGELGAYVIWETNLEPPNRACQLCSIVCFLHHWHETQLLQARQVISERTKVTVNKQVSHTVNGGRKS